MLRSRGSSRGIHGLLVDVSEPVRMDTSGQLCVTAGGSTRRAANRGAIPRRAAPELASKPRGCQSQRGSISTFARFPIADDFRKRNQMRDGWPSRSYTLERAVCPRARLPARPSPALFGGGTGLTRRMVGILRIATPSVADCEPMAADPRYFAKGSVESTPMSTRLSIAAKAAAQVSRLPSRSRSRSRFQSVARLAASPIGLATGVGASSANALGAFTSLITALLIAPR